MAFKPSYLGIGALAAAFVGILYLSLGWSDSTASLRPMESSVPLGAPSAPDPPHPQQPSSINTTLPPAFTEVGSAIRPTRQPIVHHRPRGGSGKSPPPPLLADEGALQLQLGNLSRSQPVVVAMCNSA
eukprot:RCo035499